MNRIFSVNNYKLRRFACWWKVVVVAFLLLLGEREKQRDAEKNSYFFNIWHGNDGCKQKYIEFWCMMMICFMHMPTVWRILIAKWLVFSFFWWDGTFFCVLGVKDVYIGRNDLWLAANFSKPYGVSEHLKRTLTGNNSSAYSLCIQQQNISLFQVPWMLEFVGVFLSRDHNVLNGNELHFSL